MFLSNNGKFKDVNKTLHRCTFYVRFHLFLKGRHPSKNRRRGACEATLFWRFFLRGFGASHDSTLRWSTRGPYLIWEGGSTRGSTRGVESTPFYPIGASYISAAPCSTRSVTRSRSPFFAASNKLLKHFNPEQGRPADCLDGFRH